MARAAVCAAIAAMALALRASDAACPPGVTQPSVTTVMASTINPGRDAWVVKPDCTYDPVSLPPVGILAFTSFKDLDRIESIPTDTKHVSVNNASLSRGADLSRAAKLETVTIFNFGAGLFANLKLPSTLKAALIYSGPGESFDKLSLPATLQSLSLMYLGISSLKSLSSSLLELDLSVNAFSDINFPIPPNLQQLIMNRNPLVNLERITFPDSLTSFQCIACAITKIVGVKWSSKLTILALADNPIREFEVRQSDFDVLSTLAKIDFQPIQTTCSDEEATVQVIQYQKFCVIPDKRFEILYGGNAETSSNASNDKATDSTTASGDDSAASGGTEGSNNNSTSGRTGSNGGKTVGGNGQDPSSGNGGGTKETIVVNTSSSPISSTVIGILIAVSSVFGILFALISYRHYRLSKEKAAANTLMPYDTPKATKNEDPASSNGDGSSQEYLSNDIRNDKTIIPYRIDEKRITLSKQIARGGFGVIFRGVYSGRAVAVKQMLPDAWRNETQLIDFMDEIRLCASLSHPKIVEFIGVAWTSLRDISVVIEFMDGGDLHAALQRHVHGQPLSSSTTSLPSSATSTSSSSTPFVPSPREWFERWTTASINSKTSIARDVAEAVVYLHSFSNPIVHRDLKARNVLLDSHGNAKLSDFGISREMAVDETMTSEVGTSAWIAPEVLRGDRYSERADMYSFGVLLVELDKCRHPYAGEEIFMMTDGSSVRLAPLSSPQQQRQTMNTQSQAMHQNMQITMLVSAGRLRPKPSATCPPRVQALITKCLSFAPEDRPSAMEAHYELRQILADR